MLTLIEKEGIFFFLDVNSTFSILRSLLMKYRFSAGLGFSLLAAMSIKMT